MYNMIRSYMAFLRLFAPDLSCPAIRYATMYAQMFPIPVEKENAMLSNLQLTLVKNRNARGGFSLIELLVVMALLVVLSAGMYKFYLGKGTGKPGEAKTPMTATYDSVCLQNLRSVRQCIEAAHTGDTDMKYPAALTEIKELSPELRACPEGKEPYVYNSQTGEVHCVHPGHEKY